MDIKRKFGPNAELVWKDRRRRWGLPWSFTVYALTQDKLLIDSGIFNKTLEEVLLYRVIDLTIKRSFIQRIFRLGTIHCCTRDKSTPEFDIINIRNVVATKELISQTIEESRIRKGYTVRELMGNSADDGENEHDELME